ELVHERLDREDVFRRRERAERRRAERRGLDMQHDAGAWDPVVRLGVAPGRLGAPPRIESAAGMHVGVLVVAPRRDLSACIERGRDLEERLRSGWCERELLRASPL